MASKQVEVAGIGPVTVLRRKGTRSIKLRIKPDGQITVTVPSWLPYQAGIQFAQARKTWIAKHQPRHELLSDKQLIGKSYRLHFEPTASTKTSTRLGQNKILVKYPKDLSVADTEIQAVATAAAIKALKKDAEALLPQRVQVLADKYGFTYGNVKVRNMQSRWGSCSAQKDLTFNIFLLQLPWQLIDYVILHELTHTIYLNHSVKFWAHIKGILPDVDALRKTLRKQQPHINTFDSSQL